MGKLEHEPLGWWVEKARSKKIVGWYLKRKKCQTTAVNKTHKQGKKTGQCNYDIFKASWRETRGSARPLDVNDWLTSLREGLRVRLTYGSMETSQVAENGRTLRMNGAKDEKWKNYPLVEELRAGRHVSNRDSVICSCSESQSPNYPSVGAE